jgi:hypothetical protein
MIRCEGCIPPLLLFLLISLLSACAGTPAKTSGDQGSGDPAGPDSGQSSPLPDEAVPPAAEDLSASLWVSKIAPGVGVFTRDPRDPAAALEAGERDRISASFREAYALGLNQGIPLEGVLGGDQVHGWPSDAPLAWVQNWKSAEAYPNSWGLPSLVLAIRGLAGGEVFLVRGAILDAYGKGNGLDGANGVTGYGAPLSGEFTYRASTAQGYVEGYAQRFERGIMAVNAEGRAAFIPNERPVSGE